MDGVYEDIDDFEDNERIHRLEEENRTYQDQLMRAIEALKKYAASNEDLKNKNKVLLENMSSLLKTATTEIARKDRTIAELRLEMDNIIFRRNEKSAKDEPVNSRQMPLHRTPPDSRIAPNMNPHQNFNNVPPTSNPFVNPQIAQSIKSISVSIKSGIPTPRWDSGATSNNPMRGDFASGSHRSRQNDRPNRSADRDRSLPNREPRLWDEAPNEEAHWDPRGASNAERNVEKSRWGPDGLPNEEGDRHYLEVSNEERDRDLRDILEEKRRFERHSLSTEEHDRDFRGVPNAPNEELFRDHRGVPHEEHIQNHRGVSHEESVRDHRFVPHDGRIRDHQILPNEERFRDHRGAPNEERVRDHHIVRHEERIRDHHTIPHEERFRDHRILPHEERIRDHRGVPSEERVKERRVAPHEERVKDHRGVPSEERHRDHRGVPNDERIRDHRVLPHEERFRNHHGVPNEERHRDMPREERPRDMPREERIRDHRGAPNEERYREDHGKSNEERHWDHSRSRESDPKRRRSGSIGSDKFKRLKHGHPSDVRKNDQRKREYR